MRTLPLILILAGCFAEFPTGTPARSGSDAGDAVVRPDGPPDPDDGVPPDVARRRDGGGLDAGDAFGRPDVDPNRCDALEIAETEVRIRSWGGLNTPAQVAIGVRGMNCENASVASEVEWLETLVNAGDEQVIVTARTGALASGRHVGAVEFRLGDQRTLVTVTVDLLRPPPPDASRHVLVIGVDGLSGDALGAVETPTIDWLVEQGAYTGEAWTQPGSTASAAGWTSLFTGVGVAKHGVQDEDFSVRDARYRSFIKLAAGDLRGRGGETLMAYSLPGIYESLHSPADLDGAFAGEGSLRMLGEALTVRPVHLAFAHVFNVDAAGNVGGHSLENPDYLAAVEKMDATVDDLMAAILARPTVASENWLFVLSADNGGAGDGDHASTIPLLVAGPNIAPQAIDDGSHLDVHPTVMAFLGLPPGLGIEGRAIGERRREMNCDDDVDDDGNGLTDCDDEACATAPNCVEPAPEVCDNGVDDDRDGAVDCDDDDCVDACAPLACEAEVVEIGLATATGSTDAAQNWLAASCGEERGQEAVFEFTAPRAGRYVFNTIGTEFDTVISLISPDCDGAEVGCNDDSVMRANAPGDDTDARRASLIGHDMAGGDTVAVTVAGFRGATGEFQLNVHEIECGGPRIDYDLGSRGVQVYEFDNTGRPTFYGGRCAGAGHEVSWRWTVPRSGIWQIDTIGSEIDTVMNLISPDCGSWRICNDDAALAGGGTRPEAGIREEFDAGEEFVIVVSGRDAATGNLVLRMELIP